MGDHATFSGSGANVSGAETLDKGKGKAFEDPMEMSMDEDEVDSDESDGEEMVAEEEEDNDDGPDAISESNIISGGRRTRGKNIDFQEAAEKYRADAMEDSDEDDDEDFVPRNDDDDDNKMRG